MMIYQKKVSVIIPFYNCVEWLSEAVQSVLEQTYKNIEIIVINDGSKENIQPFLDKYGDIIIYRYQENQGMPTARNLGMKIASGEYIAFEDEDDIWLPQKLEKQIRFMEENKFVWSHTGFYNWWPESGKLKRVNNEHDYGDIKKQLYISIKIAEPSVVLNRIIINEHPEIIFPPEMKKGSAGPFFRKLSKNYKLALIQEPLVKVRRHGNNTNSQVLVRFEKHALAYINNKNNINYPEILKFTGIYYYFLYKIFGTKRGKIKEFIAKCFWSIPYIIERIYIRLFYICTRKDEKYILRE